MLSAFCRRCATFVVLALGALAAQAQPSAPVASLDRSQVRIGESVNLNLVAEGQGMQALPAPDFTPLEVDFELLGRSTSSHFSLIGGQTVARTTWSVELLPRRTGILRIPPIPVGTRASAPLSLTVSDAPPPAEGEAEDLFLELEITPRDPYVHQSVQMVLRLYYAVGLTEGNLREPEVEDAAMTRVGQDRNYVAERHGRRYQVVERVFSLRPERSGTVRIGPAQFQGRALRPGSRRLLDPGVRISARTSLETLEVRPRPAAARGDWLPARSLVLEDDLSPDPATARVGEPLTRTVRLIAEGVALDQLPDLDHPPLTDVQIYADRPLGHSRETGGWPSAEREYRFALVPGKAGELVLPELRVAWWDVQADEPREAVLPARTVMVAAAPAGSMSAPPLIEPDALTSDGTPQPMPMPGVWPWISIGLAALWLATLGGWWWSARRRPQAASRTFAAMPDPGPAREAFRQSVRAQDAGATLSALLAWARMGDPSIGNLADLHRRLADDQQRQALDALERGRYGPRVELPVALWQTLGSAFEAGPRLTSPAIPAGDTDAVLPPLWPQRG